MSEPVQNFRTAFHGFNREDVVRFLETATARHTAEVNQLRDEIARLEGDLSLLRTRSGDGASQEELEALQAENARLKAQVEELETQLTEPAATPIRDETNWKDEELLRFPLWTVRLFRELLYRLPPPWQVQSRAPVASEDFGVPGHESCSRWGRPEADH